MIKLEKDRRGIYYETSVFFINCYKAKYGYTLASEAIAHIEKDNSSKATKEYSNASTSRVI